MSVNRGKIVLCKGATDKHEAPEGYLKVFQEAAYQCTYLPTLRFDFINLEDLKTRLLKPQSYNGLILTSPRTVEAIALAVKDDLDILKDWETSPSYCIGPSTESLAKAKLNIQNCLYSESGNAKELAKEIIKTVCKNPLLYPCSEMARETLQKTLNDEGIQVDKVTVYRTLPDTELENNLNKALASKPNIFVFFSPSVVEFVTKLLKKQPEIVEVIQFVAIGPVTAEALEKQGLKVSAVSEKPEANSLLRAIENIVK